MLKESGTTTPAQDRTYLGEASGLTAEQSEKLSNAAKVLLALTTEPMQRSYPRSEQLISALGAVTQLDRKDLVEANRFLRSSTDNHPVPYMDFISENGELRLEPTEAGEQLLESEIARIQNEE